jgi:NTP pyrophosphatase (non-canonical NTP hydrolase)
MPSLLIAGLGGRCRSDDWRELIGGRLIVARSLAHARAALPAHVDVVEALDDEFSDAPIVGAVDRVIDRVASHLREADVAYLVPGFGSVGDATASRLVEQFAPEIAAGSASVRPASPLQVVDALELAVAEELRPFDTGLTSIDPTRPLLLTNWYGTAVVPVARRRLERLYGGVPDIIPDADGCVQIDPPPVLGGAAASFAALGHIAARLRRPDGCPWDREQTAASLLPDLREEVDELAEAVGRADWDNVREELGDLLLHVMMQAQIAHESGHFSIDDVVAGITAKLVRRHPHVFGDVRATTPAEVLDVWKRVKHAEKQASGT